MKKGVCWLLLLLLASSPALAGEYWTSRDDFHYHALSDCQGMARRAPISENAAAEFEKYACPVCVPEVDGGEGVQAIARGGTIVLCFSDAWLAKPELTGVFGWAIAVPERGAQAEQTLASLLHGEAYRAFRQEYAESGRAEAFARYPDILEYDTRCQILNMRHIGSHWYVILRPEERFEESYSICWRIDENRIIMEDGELRNTFEYQTMESNLELELERSSSAPVYDRKSGRPMRIKAFRELGANIVVITMPEGIPITSEEQRMSINDTDLGIVMEGYMDGDAAVFCCILSDGELHALQNSRSFRIGS